MSLQKPLEGLLRPPLEWYTTGVATVSGLLCLAYPRQFFLENGWSTLMAMSLFLGAYWRAKQGYRVWRYQRRLKQMPVY